MTRNKLRISAAILTLLFIITCIASVYASVYKSYTDLQVTQYTIETKGVTKDINIVVLTDLHCNEFGENNSLLYEKIRRSKPDMIFTVGDMINSYSTDFSHLPELYQNLKAIAPTYCSVGNHETGNVHAQEIKEILKEHTTALLDTQYIDITVNGCDLRIGGLSSYLPWDEYANSFLRVFSDTQRTTLLLCHTPEFHIWGVGNYKIDLMISGHTHGGQAILPFVGGLYAPEQKFFPKFDYGFFDEENCRMIISRGLGASKQVVPRFNNPPELLHITLTAEN